MGIDYVYLKNFCQDSSMGDVYFIIYHIVNHIRSNGPFTCEAVWFVNLLMGGQGEVTLIVYILLLRANHRRHCEEELSDVAISYYERILSTYIVCRQWGDSHVATLLGMTYIMTMYIISAYYQRTPSAYTVNVIARRSCPTWQSHTMGAYYQCTPSTSLRGGQCPTWQSHIMGALYKRS